MDDKTTIQKNATDKNILYSESEEIDILALIEVIFKNSTFIIKTTFYTFVFSVIISLILTKSYLSKAKILPPQSQSSTSQLMLSHVPQGSIPSIKDTASLYEALVKTNYIIDFIISENNLDKIYKGDKESLRKKVVDSIYFESDKKSGIITIGYIDRDPKLACRIANSLIKALKKLNNSFAITEASQRRLFYEEQLKNAKEKLIESEEKLRNFQLRTGSVKIDEESKVQIEEAASLRAKISAKEVELRVLSSYATKDSPEYKTMSDEIKALKEQLAKVQNKLPANDESIASVKTYSKYGLEFIRLMREFKYSEALYEIILKQYESAKLDEARDATVIQVIDNAEIPNIRYKPERKKIVFTFTFVSFFLSVFIVFIKEAVSNKKEIIFEFKRYLNIGEIIQSVKRDIIKIISFLTTRIRRDIEN